MIKVGRLITLLFMVIITTGAHAASKNTVSLSYGDISKIGPDARISVILDFTECITSESLKLLDFLNLKKYSEKEFISECNTALKYFKDKFDKKMPGIICSSNDKPTHIMKIHVSKMDICTPLRSHTRNRMWGVITITAAGDNEVLAEFRIDNHYGTRGGIEAGREFRWMFNDLAEELLELMSAPNNVILLK